MTNIESGSLDEKILERPERRCWFLGNFVEKESPFNSNDAEFKWGIHKKGEEYEEFKANIKAKSLAVLIKGNVRFDFLEEGGEKGREVELKKTGDFVLWGAKTFHKVKFLENTTILTVRFPSLSGDVISKKL